MENAKLFKPKYILFIDNDMVVPEGLALKLIEADKDIVAALAVMRTRPYVPVAYEKKMGQYEPIDNLPENQLVECDAVGFGAVLIKMDVFEKIKKPYFAHPAIGDLVVGEDIFFCKKAQEAGFSIFMDTSIKCGHIGDYTFTYEDYLDYKKEVGVR